MNDSVKDILIVGSGGFAKEVAFLIDQINLVNQQWNLLGYVDQNIGKSNGKYSIFQNDDWLLNHNKEIYVVIGIGNPVMINKLKQQFKTNANIKFPNLIHPTVVIDPSRVDFGEGNIICAGNIFTIDIEIGSFNIFNLSCTIGHDTVIGNSNVLNPNVNISGGVRIGHNCLLGTSSTVLQYVDIADNITIGAGAVVTKSLSNTGTYVGMPAKLI